MALIEELGLWWLLETLIFRWKLSTRCELFAIYSSAWPWFPTPSVKKHTAWWTSTLVTNFRELRLTWSFWETHHSKFTVVCFSAICLCISVCGRPILRKYLIWYFQAVLSRGCSVLVLIFSSWSLFHADDGDEWRRWWWWSLYHN